MGKRNTTKRIGDWKGKYQPHDWTDNPSGYMSANRIYRVDGMVIHIMTYGGHEREVTVKVGPCGGLILPGVHVGTVAGWWPVMQQATAGTAAPAEAK